VWDAKTGMCTSILQGHSNDVHLNDMQSLFGQDDVSRYMMSWKGHLRGVNSVSWSHDSKKIVSGSGDNTLRVWDSKTGKCISTLIGHLGSVTSVAFSDDSKMIVSGSSDKTLRIWDIETGECLSTLHGHSDAVTSVAWSCDDSRRIVSGSNDKTVRVWDSVKIVDNENFLSTTTRKLKISNALAVSSLKIIPF